MAQEESAAPAAGRGTRIDDFMESLSEEDWKKMGTTKEERLAARKERRELDARAPKVGDQIPDFEVETLAAEGSRSGETISLSSLRGKPAALIFGCYTCPIFYGQVPRFEEAFQKFGDQVNFLLIYVKEAHPEDGWQVPQNTKLGIVYNQPRTIEARAVIATDCMRGLDMTMPIALDGIENPLDQVFVGSPERLYISDAEGRIVYQGPLGPFGDDVIDDWLSHLEQIAAG